MTHARGELHTGDPTPGDGDVIVAGFEQLPSAAYVFEGPQHVIVAANAAARALLGNRPLIGREYTDAVPEAQGQRLAELLDRAYRQGEAVTGREWRLLVNDPAGDMCEYFVTFSIVPTRHADGSVGGALAQLIDVTADVRAREAAAAGADATEQRYQDSQVVVRALQDSLLPEYLPVLPGLRLAAHYLVAAREQAAGGDWFDAVPMPDGRVALVAGDVVGHGARASAVMGQLRAVLSAFLHEGLDVAEVLARLDRFVARLPGAAATTVCLAVLDATTGEVTYARCGHPPPLLVAADGNARFLPAGPGAPLGTAAAAPVPQRATLAPGDILVLYTDGLVERPDRSIETGMDQLRTCAADARRHGPPQMMRGAAVDRVCRLSLERMIRDGFDDDVSLIAAERTGPPPARLRATLPALPASLGALRTQLGAWLDGLGAGADDVRDIEIAVGEAATNVIEHAYSGDGGSLVVEGYHDPAGRACLTVADTGSWCPPPVEPGARGRGFALMRCCMDTVELESSPTGTTVLMDRQLRRPAVLGNASEPAPDRPAHAAATTLRIQVERGARPRLVLRGPVDLGTVGELRLKMREVGRGGVLPLDLDLTDVSHLASAGVAALHELAEQMAGDGRALRLVAPAGSPALQVLRITGLDGLVVG